MSKYRKLNMIIALCFFACTLSIAQSNIPGTDAEQKMAIERYNSVHNTTIAIPSLSEYLKPTQANLNAWKEVLADFSDEERKNGSGPEGFAHDKTATSNALYRYISSFLVIIKKALEN